MGGIATKRRLEHASLTLTTASAETGRPLIRLIRRWGGRLALLAFSTAIVLLLAEALIRALLPQQPVLLRPDVWQPDDGLGWRHAPDLDTRVNTGEREVRLLTDGNGHRVGPEPAPPQPSYRLLALGDSYLVALQVEYSQTFAALAARRLTRDLGEPVEIVNAGVGGWSPNQYLLEARHELKRRRYDYLLVFFYLGNDIQSVRIEHFAPRRPVARHALRWPRRATRQEIVGGLLYPLNDYLETRSHLFLLFKHRLTFVLMRLGLSARGFPSGMLRQEAQAARWTVSAELCHSIAEEAEVPVLFVLLPGICDVDLEVAEVTARAVGLRPAEIDPDQPSRRMADELGRRGLAVLDLTPRLRAAHGAGRRDLFGRVDIHYDVGGHQVVAEALSTHLLGALPRRRGGGRASGDVRESPGSEAIALRDRDPESTTDR